MKNLKTTAEIAEYLRRPVLTLVNWRSRREGPPFLRVGGSVLYDMGKVDQWLEEHTVTHRDVEGPYPDS